MAGDGTISATVVFSNQTALFMSIVSGALEKALDECGGFVAEEARAMCPVDTGALQSTIRHEVESETTVVVSAGGHSDVRTAHANSPSYVDYADAVEFGTSKTPAQPFLQPAAANNTGEIEEIFRRNLG
jgi:HK97 gp10 family phage protein